MRLYGRFLVAFTALWAAALLWIYRTQQEMGLYFLLLYTFLGGIAVYLVSGALVLLLQALRKRRSGAAGLREAVGGLLLLSPLVAVVWYAYTH